MWLWLYNPTNNFSCFCFIYIICELSFWIIVLRVISHRLFNWKKKLLTVDVVRTHTEYAYYSLENFQIHIRVQAVCEGFTLSIKFDFFHPIFLLFKTRYLINTKLSEILIIITFYFESIWMSFLLYECWILYVLINVLNAINICFNTYEYWYMVSGSCFCFVMLEFILFC